MIFTSHSQSALLEGFQALIDKVESCFVAGRLQAATLTKLTKRTDDLELRLAELEARL